MKDLAQLAVDEALRLGATYADFRYEKRSYEGISVKNGAVEGVEHNGSEGFGIRVVAGGSWGFSSSRNVSKREVGKIAKRAVAIAKASARVQAEPVTLDDSPIASQPYSTPFSTDPFAVPIEEKVAVLQENHREMAGVAGIFLTEGGLSFWKKEQFFGSSQGGFVGQTILESGAECACFALKDSELQRRSYPSYHGGNVATAGYEFIKELDLPGHGRELAQEAVDLLTADPCPEKETTLVIGSSQLALQVHESVGHPTELDRVFGTEISFAGGSWVRPQDVGSLKYGSPEMNIVCDAMLPRGLGTFGFDDEGVPAQRYHLVKNGILLDALSSRESAAKIGRRSTGAMRADGWNRIPLVRMTNVSLEAGNQTLDQLLADIEDGIFVETNKSWSIDDRRLNFQFATEYAREIRGGKLGRLLKNPIYQGMTPVFWGSLDARGDASTWKLWGLPTCGKGQPIQSAHVSHGAPAGRFRNVKVRASK